MIHVFWVTGTCLDIQGCMDGALADWDEGGLLFFWWLGA